MRLYDDIHSTRMHSNAYPEVHCRQLSFISCRFLALASRDLLLQDPQLPKTVPARRPKVRSHHVLSTPIYFFVYSSLDG